MFELIDSLSGWPLATGFFLFGLIWGSFANVLILRLPAGESVVKPRSRCPQCKTQIAAYDNIPVLSWLFLRGQCRQCKKTIPWRYPLVEILTASLFAGLYLAVGLNWTLLEYLIFGFGLIVVTFIDFDHMILPDVFTLAGMVLGLIGGALNPERSFMAAVAGLVFGGGFLWAIAYVYETIRKEEGMGGGDIKLLAWIGAVLGWQAIPFVILSSSIIGSIVGVLVMVKTKGGLRSTIPFGPYLALGAVVYIFGGREIGAWYLSLFVPSFSPVN